MSYLPLTDAGLLSWSLNFQEQLAALADPTTVGLTTENVTEYTAAQADYATKLNIANAPATRGGATIHAKNQSKKALVALSRSFAMTITKFQGVTDQQRYEFGLTVDGEPTPVPPPPYSPEMDMLPVVGRTVKIRLHNEKTLGHRGKPHGVTSAAVYSYIGEAPSDNLHDWKQEALSSRAAIDVEFPPSLAPGTKVWLTAYWLNAKMESGPACQPQGVNLAGGVSKAA